MDLHNLHRPSPASAAQQKQDPVPAGVQGSLAPPDEAHRLRKELDKALSHAHHWQQETIKMDKIARQAMDKLDAKRAAKQALKTECLAAQKQAEIWQSRYKELSKAAEAHTGVITHECQAAHTTAAKPRDTDLQATQKALRQREDQLQAVQKALRQHEEQLQAAQNALRQHQAEVPLVQERLKVGGSAFRKLQTIEPRLAASEQRVRDLQAEIANLQTASTRKADLDAAKIRQTESDLATTKDKLRAATQEASAKTAQVHACRDMLARTEQVLKTCSQLYASKDEGHPLAQALMESTEGIQQFLAKTEPKRA